jgi:hypothetical protein
VSLQTINTIAIAVIALFAIVTVIASYHRAKDEQLPRPKWARNWLADMSTEMAGTLPASR